MTEDKDDAMEALVELMEDDDAFDMLADIMKESDAFAEFEQSCNELEEVRLEFIETLKETGAKKGDELYEKYIEIFGSEPELD